MIPEDRKQSGGDGRTTEQNFQAFSRVYNQSLKQVFLNGLIPGDEQFDAFKQGMADHWQVRVEFEASRARK